VPKQFRFGISVRDAASRSEWREKAQRIEALGFDTMLTADHLADGMFPPLTALLAAADATTRLRVGTLVINNDFRHPVLLAREAATVDLLSEGRFELGLGAGHMKHEYDEAGLAFDGPATRVARMAESADIIRRLLDGDEVTHDGTFYRVRGHRSAPLPVQQPVPMLIGGNGPRVLSLAARLADIVGFTGFSQVEGERGVSLTRFTDSGLATQVALVREAAGDRFDRLELQTLVQGVTLPDDRRAAAEQVQPLVPGLGIDEILASPYVLIGTVEEIAQQLRDRREKFGISYLVVFERDLDAMAEVRACLINEAGEDRRV
jgi:probable F420-dependent oxidoreductase